MLPQRRKSAEEIAKLRESMGIPGAIAPQAEPADPGDRLDGAEPVDGGEGLKSRAVAEALPPSVAKPVRSLRKSERMPENRERPAVPLSPAGIPLRRRSEEELMEMRRQQATPPDQSIAHLRQMELPWPVIVFVYLLPLCGALCAWFAVWSPGVPPLDFPAPWLADLSRQPWLAKAGLGALGVFCGGAFLLAGWISWKKPRSRHHAGFISIINLLVLVFGILKLTSTHGP